MNKSPLRYPGGKSRYIKKILPYIPGDRRLVSPFFGGGHIELACMERGQDVVGNDAFYPLANFWYCMSEYRRGRDVIKQVRSFYASPEKYKDIFYEGRSRIFDCEEYLAAAYYFFINRCSFSGATLSGGFSGEAAISRFTDSSIKNLELVNTAGLNQCFYNTDFEYFLQHASPEKHFIYADPPYYEIGGLYGKNGDMSFVKEDHDRLSKILKGSGVPFALSYNDCPEVRILYADYEFIELKPSQSMSNGKKSCPEVLILNVDAL